MWAKALLNVCRDPEASHPETVVYYDEKYLVMRDKFPKAIVHLLALPRCSDKKIPYSGPLDFRAKSDAAVIREMIDVAHKALEQTFPDQSLDQIRFGFHMHPSMQPLHMHIISTDFNSPSLKTAKHWNSFTTDFFVDALDLAERLEACSDDADARRIIETQFGNEERANKLLKTPLRCHRCGEKMRTIPQLKEHIISCPSPASVPFAS